MRPVLAEFLRWWTGELASLLPLSMRRALRPPRAEAWLASGEVLVRRVTLPLAAEENLREVLAFEMDRLTPYGADEVWFDVVVTGRDAGQGRLGVELVAARREVAEAAAARAGPDVSALRVEGLGEAINLLPPSRRRRLGGTGRVLAALVVVLAAVAAGLPLIRVQADIARLEESLAQARAGAAEAEALRRRIDQALAAERFVLDRRQRRPAALDALAALTVLLPDDAFLQHYQASAEGVRMQGMAAASAQVLRAVEDSPLWAEAAFRAPVTRDAASDRERFSLAARWEAP